MNHKITSWTGSELDRRPQGDCRGPLRPSEPHAHYVIEPGKPAQLKKLCQSRWRRITTRKVTKMPSIEVHEGGHYVFRLNGWLLKIHESQVTKAITNEL